MRRLFQLVIAGLAGFIICYAVQHQRQAEHERLKQDLIKITKENEFKNSCYRRLLSLDRTADIYENKQLMARLRRTKELLRTDTVSKPFAIAAQFVSANTERQTTTFALDYWDGKNKIRGIEFLSHNGQVIASGPAPFEIFVSYEMPLRFILVKVRSAKNGKSNTERRAANVYQAQGNVEDIRQVVLVDNNGQKLDPIAVKFYEELTLDP